MQLIFAFSVPKTDLFFFLRETLFSSCLPLLYSTGPFGKKTERRREGKEGEEEGTSKIVDKGATVAAPAFHAHHAIYGVEVEGEGRKEEEIFFISFPVFSAAIIFIVWYNRHKRCKSGNCSFNITFISHRIHIRPLTWEGMSLLSTHPAYVEFSFALFQLLNQLFFLLMTICFLF